MGELQLYSRQGCHLCEDMLDALRQFQTDYNYTILVHDVDDDKALFERFNTLVPVVYYNGRELMRYHFELATLTKAFDAN